MAHHSGSTRAGFLVFAAAMLLLVPAMAVMRRSLESSERRRATSAGSRLIAVAARVAAIGNAFAPTALTSAVRPQPAPRVMITFIRDHFFSGWNVAIAAFYPLLPIGALMLAFGLWHSTVFDRLTVALVTVPLIGLIFAPLEPATSALYVVLEIGFIGLGLRTRVHQRADSPSERQVPVPASG